MANSFGYIDEFLQNSTWEEIDEYFLDRCVRGSPEEIRYMVEMGVDPRMRDDLPFIKSCARDGPEVPLYFLQECGADVNSQSGHVTAMDYACKSCVIKLLMDHGYVPSDGLIYTLIYSSFGLPIEIFLEYGIDAERIARIFLDYKFNRDVCQKFILEALKKHNVDWTQLIQNL